MFMNRQMVHWKKWHVSEQPVNVQRGGPDRAFSCVPSVCPISVKCLSSFPLQSRCSGIYYSALKTSSRLQIAVKGRPFFGGVGDFFFILPEVVWVGRGENAFHSLGVLFFFFE